MKCILCDCKFPDRSLEEISEDEAIEYLCNTCYETDFEIVHNVPSANSFRDDVQDTIAYFVSDKLRKSAFILDEE